jgi:hypothetical protein
MKLTQATFGTLTMEQLLLLELAVDDSNAQQVIFDMDMVILNDPTHPDYNTTMEKYEQP